MLTKPVTTDLANYQRRLRRFPILEAKDKARLIKRWSEDSDREAAPTSHEPTALGRHGRAFAQAHVCQYWPTPLAIPGSSHGTTLAPDSSKP